MVTRLQLGVTHLPESHFVLTETLDWPVAFGRVGTQFSRFEKLRNGGTSEWVVMLKTVIT